MSSPAARARRSAAGTMRSGSGDAPPPGARLLDRGLRDHARDLRRSGMDRHGPARHRASGVWRNRPVGHMDAAIRRTLMELGCCRRVVRLMVRGGAARRIRGFPDVGRARSWVRSIASRIKPARSPSEGLRLARRCFAGVDAVGGGHRKPLGRMAGALPAGDLRLEQPRGTGSRFSQGNRRRP